MPFSAGWSSRLNKYTAEHPEKTSVSRYDEINVD
jgi:hypothetical protein